MELTGDLLEKAATPRTARFLTVQENSPPIDREVFYASLSHAFLTYIRDFWAVLRRRRERCSLSLSSLSEAIPCACIDSILLPHP